MAAEAAPFYAPALNKVQVLCSKKACRISIFGTIYEMFKICQE